MPIFSGGRAAKRPREKPILNLELFKNLGISRHPNHSEVRRRARKRDWCEDCDERTWSAIQRNNRHKIHYENPDSDTEHDCAKLSPSEVLLRNFDFEMKYYNSWIRALSASRAPVSENLYVIRIGDHRIEAVIPSCYCIDPTKPLYLKNRDRFIKYIDVTGKPRISQFFDRSERFHKPHDLYIQVDHATSDHNIEKLFVYAETDVACLLIAEGEPQSGCDTLFEPENLNFNIAEADYFFCVARTLSGDVISTNRERRRRRKTQYTFSIK